MGRYTHYHLYSGKITRSVKPLTYNYSRTTGIKLRVTRGGFSIDVNRSVKKEASSLLRDPLFRDAIKKAVIIQLIKYGFYTDADLYADINGKVTCLYDSKVDATRKLIYSLCGRKLQRPMTQPWTDDSLLRVLSSTKSKANRLDAALDALLIAKSKFYETERFIYLWMAINGLYGYVAEFASEYMQSKKERDWIKKEFSEIKFFAMILGYPYRGRFNGTEDDTVKVLELLLTHIGNDRVDDFINAAKNNDMNNRFVEGIHDVFEKAGVEAGKMHPYAAMLLFMPYKVRCKYFHAEKAVPLICFEEEHPLPVLRVLNRVMEDYLDENLNRWFDSGALNDFFIPRIISYAENCVCDKNSYLSSCVVDGEEKG